jgi:23S rRNA pseudouridine1911/1915/1917 synthase
MPSPHRPRWTVDADEAGTRLDKFLAAAVRLGSRGRVSSALERGKVLVDGVEARAEDAARRVREGETIELWVDRPGTASRRPGAYRAGDLHILFEDAVLIVLNKPAGMLSVPLERRPEARSAYALIEDHLRPAGKRRPLAVHRIDRDTSGLVIFAKTSRAQEALKAQFRRREPERVYQAVVYGRPQPREGTWRDRLRWDRKALVQKEVRASDPRGIEAVSHYRMLEAFAGASLVEVRLNTGRRNQIRIQAAVRGHPLVGERRYTSDSAPRRPIAFPRQALHSYRLAFEHPDGRALTFEAPLPPDFAGLLARLRRGTTPRAG